MTKTPKKMRRKIPLFRVNVDPQYAVDYSQLTHIPEVEGAVMRETFSAIIDGMKRNKKSTPIFEIAGTNCYVELDRSQWKPTLEHLIKYYEDKEEYEMCGKCKQLINKL